MKSENGGNDPSVVLVPSGGGWANKDGKKEGSVEKKLVQTSDPGQKQASTGADVAQASQTKQGSPLSSASKSGTKSWSSVTGSGHSPGQESGRKPQYLHQKSPLFGQEFPSLAGENVPAGSTIARETMLEQDRSQPPPGQDMSAPPDPAYGPGPNLRPQTFGNWTQGGGKAGGGGPMTEEEDKLLPAAPQPHKPQPPTASGKSHGTTQFKSIMPPFMDAMELPTGPPQSYGKKPSSRNNPAFRQGRDNNRPRPDNTASFTNHSIIDKEKLQKMDDFDNGNDWTFDDDDFDYNKKLESDDDETSEANQSNSMTSDPNWADQVHSNHQSQHNKNSQSYYYDDYKTKPAVGFDDEERRRNKKSEEVMKNIERARQRREEEENRYRDNRDRQSDHYRDSYNGGHRSGGQARRYDDRQQYDGYDRKKDDYRARYERDDDAHARRETREGWESGDRSQRSYQRHDSELSATESLEDRKQVQIKSL